MLATGFKYVWGNSMYLGGLKVTDGVVCGMLKVDMHGYSCNTVENTYIQTRSGDFDTMMLSIG